MDTPLKIEHLHCLTSKLLKQYNLRFGERGGQNAGGIGCSSIGGNSGFAASQNGTNGSINTASGGGGAGGASGTPGSGGSGIV